MPLIPVPRPEGTIPTYFKFGHSVPPLPQAHQTPQLSSLTPLQVLKPSPKPRITIQDLPNEVLSHIFRDLPYASQICLGLTCKALGRLLETIEIEAYRDVTHTHGPRRFKSMSQRYLLKCSLLKQLKDWMPRTYKLCHQCHTYVREDGHLWKKSRHLRGIDLSDGIVIYEQSKLSRRRDSHCPKCYDDAYGGRWGSVTRAGWKLAFPVCKNMVVD
jgi:hypothetical protein